MSDSLCRGDRERLGFVEDLESTQMYISLAFASVSQVNLFLTLFRSLRYFARCDFDFARRFSVNLASLIVVFREKKMFENHGLSSAERIQLTLYIFDSCFAVDCSASMPVSYRFR